MVLDSMTEETTYGRVIHRTWTNASLSRHVAKPSSPPTRTNVARASIGTGKATVEEPDCLGKAIRERRRDLGLTQEQLAERVNSLGAEIRQSDISRLEHGKVTLPHHARLQRIAAALNLPFGEFLALAGWAGAEEAMGQRLQDPA